LNDDADGDDGCCGGESDGIDDCASDDDDGDDDGGGGADYDDADDEGAYSRRSRASNPDADRIKSYSEDIRWQISYESPIVCEDNHGIYGQSSHNSNIANRGRTFWGIDSPS
jgi:hypothetical protein